MSQPEEQPLKSDATKGGDVSPKDDALNNSDKDNQTEDFVEILPNPQRTAKLREIIRHTHLPAPEHMFETKITQPAISKPNKEDPSNCAQTETEDIQSNSVKSWILVIIISLMLIAIALGSALWFIIAGSLTK